MKIALIGYGKMGKTIEQIAKKRGHSIVSIIDVNNPDDFNSEAFKSAEVAIEFTRPDSALENYRKTFEANVPIVSGTTGWTSELDEVKKSVEKNGNTFLWSSNFSIGVNIFMALNEHLAKIMNQFPDYDVEITEVHHIHKLDAPSGTAITLAEDILKNLDRKNSWVKENELNSNELAIKSIREGEIAGIHTIEYESSSDKIAITHDSKNREGLALGAVLAAEFIKDKKGYFTIKDMFKF